MNGRNGSKVLVRSRKGRMVAGLCAGVADHFGIDVILVRAVSYTHLTDAPVMEGGIAVAPASFGRYGGDLVGPDETTGRVFAIGPDGTVATLAESGLPHGGDIGVESTGFVPPGFSASDSAYPVSYTHLDVYKRQCEDSTTDTPSAAIAVITEAMKSCRATGSSIATGSSSSSSRGRLASARVSASWACWPPDSLPAFRFSGMPSSPSRVSA